MEIKNREDWIALAKQTVPLLPEYMADMHGNVDAGAVEEVLSVLLEGENWMGLCSKFNEIWSRLPDASYIRRRPFFDLCDLCSESWVLEPEGA